MKRFAYFAGGCFWGLEELFSKQKGVLEIIAGYCGGSNANPSYENHPGHAETIEIAYDESKIDFWHLLDFFFRIHDPTTKDRQGNDVGNSYRSAIFYQSEEERKEAEDFIKIVNGSHRWSSSVITSLEPFKVFYKAEDYHQDYLKKNPNGYTCHKVYFASFLTK